MTRWFADLKIRTKIMTAVGVVLAGTAAMGVFSIERMGAVNEQSTAIMRDWVPGIERIGAVKSAIANLRVLEYNDIVVSGEAEQRDVDQRIEKALHAILIPPVMPLAPPRHEHVNINRRTSGNGLRHIGRRASRRIRRRRATTGHGISFDVL